MGCSNGSKVQPEPWSDPGQLHRLRSCWGPCRKAQDPLLAPASNASNFASTSFSRKSPTMTSTPPMPCIGRISRAMMRPASPRRSRTICDHPPGAAPRSTTNIPGLSSLSRSISSSNLNTARDRHPAWARFTKGSLKCSGASENWFCFAPRHSTALDARFYQAGYWRVIIPGKPHPTVGTLSAFGLHSCHSPRSRSAICAVLPIP